MRSLLISLRPGRVHASRKVNHLHFTARQQNPLIYGGLALATAAIGLQYAIKIYNSLPQKSTLDSPQDGTEVNKEPFGETKQTNEEGNSDKARQESIFDAWFAKKFYEGGFEDKMTKREAALILGVRESSATERIKDAHRRILLLNHPDRGGSAYVAAKVNEAKDLLLKGKQ